MSFRCDRCKCAQPLRAKPKRVVVETRPRVYPSGSEGTEVVREEDLCRECATRVRSRFKL